MPNRSLALRREALADLSTDDLRDLATGAPTLNVSCPVTDCVLPSRELYCFSPSFTTCITHNCTP